MTSQKALRRTLGTVLTQMVLSGMGRSEIMSTVAAELRGMQKGGRR